ncbi:MAG: hypothetical protein ACK5N0_08870, partial [Synechococcaceae cyanobacterium]
AGLQGQLDHGYDFLGHRLGKGKGSRTGREGDLGNAPGAQPPEGFPGGSKTLHPRGSEFR